MPLVAAGATAVAAGTPAVVPVATAVLPVVVALPAFAAPLVTASPPPPKAPPISAPEVPIFTFAIPQSLPLADKNLSEFIMLFVKIDEDSHSFVALDWGFPQN